MSNENNLGAGKEFLLRLSILGSNQSSRDIRARTQGENMKQKPRRNAAQRLSFSGSRSCRFLTQPISACSGQH